MIIQELKQKQTIFLDLSHNSLLVFGAPSWYWHGYGMGMGHGIPWAFVLLPRR
jgi:hypothetical protein